MQDKVPIFFEKRRKRWEGREGIGGKKGGKGGDKDGRGGRAKDGEKGERGVVEMAMRRAGGKLLKTFFAIIIGV